MNEPRAPRRRRPFISQVAPTGEAAEATLHAIVQGADDALLIETKNGLRVYTLEDANEPYRRLIECMSEAAVILDGDGAILCCNGRLSDLLGRESLVGESFFDVLDADQRSRAEAFLAQGATSNTTTELNLRSKNEETVAFRASATPLAFNERQCVALVLTALHDIEALKLSQAVLRESEARFRAVFEFTGIGIAIIDRQGRYEEANPAYCRLLGYSLEELRRLRFTELIHPDDRAPDLDEIQRLQDEPLPHFEIENRCVRKDGKSVWSHKFVSLLRDDKGELAHAVTLVTDVTERRRKEQDLRDASRRKDEFLATLAHELRNPLTPLSNALTVLERRLAKDAETSRLHAMMTRQVTHLVRLVDDLLEVSRITSGKIELRKQPIDLKTVLHHAIETSQPLIEAKKHNLICELSPEPLQASGDPVRLSQVFANLINNAAKYTPPGGRIEISARRDGDKAIVSVRDNGMGISAEMLPHVFDLFAQAHCSAGSSQGGIGVGLALARRLVEMHGGEIAGFSEGEGRGSEFLVRLSLIGRSPHEEAIEERREMDIPRAFRRVLVIDDDHDVADSFAMLLRCLDAEAHVAYSGVEGLEAIAKFKPQLVFLDIGMPSMDGHETARRIRELEDGENIVIAALSGWGQNQDPKRGLENSFDHHFVKPVEVEVVAKLLSSLPGADSD